MTASKPSLAVVADKEPERAEPEREVNVANRIQALISEAKSLAHQSQVELINDMTALALKAAEIEAGGDVYLPGVREEARQLIETLENAMQRITKLMQSERS